MVWLGNVSVYANSLAGHKVFEALQVPDHMGFSQVGNHNHCAFPESQEPTVEAFVRKFLLGVRSRKRGARAPPARCATVAGDRRTAAAFRRSFVARPTHTSPLSLSSRT